MTMDDIIGAGLREPETAIGYETNRRVREAAAGRVVLTSSQEIELLGFAGAGHAEAKLVAGLTHEVLTNWRGPEEGLVDAPANARFEVVHAGHRLEVTAMQWTSGWQRQHRTWVVTDDEAAARAFLEQASRWSSEVHGEVLVFQDGCFAKSARLHDDLRRTSWDDPRAARRREGRDRARDFERFFASKEAYARVGCPWRRGALFLGPPGNGKTFCVKALVQRLGKPTIYVRGFRHRYRTSADCIAEVFERARRSRPASWCWRTSTGSSIRRGSRSSSTSSTASPRTAASSRSRRRTTPSAARPGAPRSAEPLRSHVRVRAPERRRSPALPRLAKSQARRRRRAVCVGDRRAL